MPHALFERRRHPRFELGPALACLQRDAAPERQSDRIIEAAKWDRGTDPCGELMSLPGAPAVEEVGDVNRFDLIADVCVDCIGGEDLGRGRDVESQTLEGGDAEA